MTISKRIVLNLERKIVISDDHKIYTELSNCDNNILQTQLDNIHQWSQTWQMKIAHTKCNILTIGRTNDRIQYVINTNSISKVDPIKDLGVTVDRELKFNIHINNIVQQANQRASQILRCFLSRNPITLVRAFKTYIRPILEYASTRWSPSYIHQINLLESVQRSFTRRIPGCSHLSYIDRLAFLKLQTLEQRRLIADLIMC